MIQIGGFVPMTTTDFPGHLAAVVFCQGCPWACGYCHNHHLQPREAETGQTWESVLAFLQKRRGLLDGVVFSGGEPTLQKDLAQAMQEVKALGFAVGLHTAGTYPARLEEILPLADWVGFDIKAPFDAYEKVTGVPGSGEAARESAMLVLEAGMPCEFRTTIHPSLHTREGLLRLAQDLAEMGVRDYVLQEFRPQGCADAALCRVGLGRLLDAHTKAVIGGRFDRFSVRPA